MAEKKNSSKTTKGTKSGARSKGLGRGLNALFESEIQAKDRTYVLQEIVLQKIDDLVPNRKQPRRVFAEEKLAELAESIKEQGIIQPLIVTSKNNQPPFVIVAGERRWRAARIAGLKEVPCVVRDLSELQMQQQALIENIVREDLNIIEEATAYAHLLTEHSLTQDILARTLGKSRSAITNTLRLLDLPEQIKEDLNAGLLSAGHARALLALPDEETRLRISEIVKLKQLSVRETESLVKRVNEPKSVQTRQHKEEDIHVKVVAEDLTKALGTKVRLTSKGNKGKIEIFYYSNDELERLLEQLL